ncbi:MAG: PAS domain S-box protein [Anditalea sp.]
MNNNHKNLLDNILLSLKDDEREDMKAFHSFFQSVEEEFNERLEKKLHDHPAFHRSFKEISQTFQKEQRRIALEIQYEAVFNNNWEPYIEDQTNQGIRFAKMGMDFFIWYDMIAMIRNILRPLLFEESNKEMNEIFTIMKGKNRFFDIRMCIIAEAYLNEKKRIIEEQKRKLAKSEEGQKQAQAIAHIGNWEKSFISKRVDWSDETFKILGLRPGEVSPSEEVYLSLIPPEDIENVKEMFKAAEKGKPYSLVHSIVRKNGEVRIVRTESQPLVNEKGSCVGMYGIIEDITEKKIAATENERLSNVIQRSLNEIYMFNSDTLKFEYINDGALRNLGYTMEEMLNMTPQDIIPKYTPSKFKKLVELLVDRMEEKVVFETDNKRKDRSLYPVEVHLQLIKEDYKRIFVAIIIDITERKKAEQIIKRNANLLAFQNSQLGDFCNIVSHNLRSPLVNMNLLVDLIEESEDINEKQKLIKKFKPIINNVNETFNELLESLQIQQNLEIKSEKVVVKNYFKKIVEGFEGQIAQSNGIIEADFDEAPVIYFPPKYLSSMLHNLISNALKYKSPQRTPIITLKTIMENGNIVLSVKDNGLGIDLNQHGEDLFKISKVFHNHPDAKGFGLYITKTQVETMGGRIWVESKPKTGSTFFVEFKNPDINPR